VIAREFSEMADRWLVPMAGLAVTQCQLDFAFSLIVAVDGNDSYYVTIEEPFSIRAPGCTDEVTLAPEQAPVQLAPALAVLRQSVEHAFAFKDGRLELAFADGSMLHAPAGEKYEPWNIVGPAGLRIVSLPNGGLAIWSPESHGAGSA